MSWLKNWWLGIAAFLVAVGLSILGRDGRRAEAAETREKELLREGTDAALRRARVERDKAEAAKHDAAQAAELTRRKLDETASKDESMADLLSSWNSHRLRDGSDT